MTWLTTGVCRLDHGLEYPIGRALLAAHRERQVQAMQLAAGDLAVELEFRELTQPLPNAIGKLPPPGGQACHCSARLPQ